MSRPVVDGQRTPKLAAMPSLSLIDPDLQLAGLPLVFEGVSMSEWNALDGWVDTEPDELKE